MAKALNPHLKGSVAWHLPTKKDPTAMQKKPFAYSTTATSQGIALLAEQTECKTPNEILPLIAYDQDAIAIMQAYIDRGFGDTTLNIVYDA